ncbi:MAG TPA: hypothetical protein VFO40_21000 [Chthoniobacterales bacterium]|nr:hypothetical protein [Chthoniobacterales bacterium]
MKKYLSAIFVFDVLLPALLLGLPGCILLWALVSFQQFADSKNAEFSAHLDRVRLVEALNRELQPVQAKVPLLKTLLSNNDVESRVDHSILAALQKFSPDEIERTLHDSQYGPSPIGPVVGEGHRLSLKFSSRWEPLTTSALEWETGCPNLLLETLSIGRSASLQASGPHLESTLSYFVITEN